MKLDKPIREWKTKKLMSEIAMADSDFWRWQADGIKPGYNCEKYAGELAEELKNRGYDYEL